MATLTIRYDIATPRFVHGFVYEGEETERAALKKAMQEAAVKAGINTETWLQSVVIHAPKVLPDASPNARQRMNSAITAWALDLSAGHPTRHGTIDEFLNYTMPVRLSERGALNRRCGAMSCSRFCLVPI
jgi:hypothetical protein